MTEEIHDIERLIKQSGELADSLLRLAQKLREQHQHDPRMHITEEQTKRLAALDDRLIDVRETIDPVKVRQAVAKQETAINVLQAAVADRTMTPAAAAEQLANLLDPGLPASKIGRAHV